MPYETISFEWGCVKQWRFEIPLDYNFCQVIVYYDHGVNGNIYSTSPANCSFSGRLLTALFSIELVAMNHLLSTDHLVSTPSTTSTNSAPVNDRSLGITDVTSGLHNHVITY